MLDINKLIAAEQMAPCDADAYLNDLDTWSEDKARQAAYEEGLYLTDAHMDVICYLRDHFAECGPDSSAHSLLRNMEQAYIEQGGRKYLYRLFPHGPSGRLAHPGGQCRSFFRHHALRRVGKKTAPSGAVFNLGSGYLIRPIVFITTQGSPEIGGNDTPRALARTSSSRLCAFMKARHSSIDFMLGSLLA